MKILPLVFMLILATNARSQEKESFYVFNADWKATKIDSAHFLLHVHQVNDSCWQWDYYHFIGPLLKTEQYLDKEGGELNGDCNYYDEKGFIDSVAAYRRGKKNGDFFRFASDSIKYKTKYVYQDDSLIEVVDFDKQKKDTAIAYKDEKESEFPGGWREWAQYLNKNLKYPDRAINANVSGDVSVSFFVNKDGQVLEPYITKSVEFSLDQEALRIIGQSGKWNPAFQNGKFVKSYKRQPIKFRLEKH